MGRYKRYDPNTVANVAWENLKAKVPEMKANYDRAVDEAIVMDGSKNAYVAGVSAWINIMRSPEIRNDIANAIAKAKRKLKERLYGVSPRAIAVPVR